MRPLTGRRFPIAAMLACAVLAPVAAAQSSPAQPSPLHVRVVTGQNALNNIRLAQNRPVTVEVRDRDDRPVMGAEVAFDLPSLGGRFADGTRRLITHTDAQGQAVARGVQPGDRTGPFEIAVAATYLGVTATTAIPQVNVAMAMANPASPAAPAAQNSSGQASPSGQGLSTAGKVWMVLGIAGGVVAGVVFATRDRDSGGSGSPGPPPIVITPGGPSVGGPQ